MPTNVHLIVAKILLLWVVIAGLFAVVPLPSAFATGLLLAVLSQPLFAYLVRAVGRPVLGAGCATLALSLLGALVWLPAAFPTDALRVLDAYLAMASTEVATPPSWLTGVSILGTDIAQRWAALAAMNAEAVHTVEQSLTLNAQAFLGAAGRADWVALTTVVSVGGSLLLQFNAKRLVALLNRVFTSITGQSGSASWLLAGAQVRRITLITIGLALCALVLAAVMYLLGGVLAMQLMGLVFQFTFLLCLMVAAAHLPLLIFSRVGVV
ncbi:hypothetical protein RBE51_21990 [Pseudomonas taiwanensis]|uniref:hypothetical protein n=1 Tax=Pseudomonas taiwanensis TaxID=470150 RepID=UPI0028DE8DE2|nr:hypothetical protein [Pseudomonas taiwanensis]MDT8925459.1 hypothetical protein [Pseudomonas taiwanensis]